MGTSQKVALGAAVGFVVTVLAIVAASMVIVPQEGRSEHFWLRIGWASFLAAIIWAYVGGLTGAREAKGGGMLQAIGGTAVAYALVSGALLLGNALLPDTSFLSRAHLVTQIILAAATLVLWVFVYFSRVQAEQDQGGG